MFNWTISLSDKQVIMLMAFYSAEDDSYECRFHSVHSMIGDAWDIRAVRKLQEYGLISVISREDARKPNIWNITDKGNFIAMAIEADADSLKTLTLRNGLQQGQIINSTKKK